jgi:hypothetical protein
VKIAKKFNSPDVPLLLALLMLATSGATTTIVKRLTTAIAARA